MSGPFHLSGVHGNINCQLQIDIHSQLDQHDKNLYEIKEMVIKYKQTQESKTLRFTSKYGENLHRPRTRQEEGYYTQTEPYKKPYSPSKEILYISFTVDQYSSSTYPRKDYKRECYSYKKFFREKTSQKVSFVDPIVSSYIPKTPFPSHFPISSPPSTKILPISTYPLNFMIIVRNNNFSKVLRMIKSVPQIMMITVPLTLTILSTKKKFLNLQF